ncbi:Uu.00g004090.m01.CDS01 [Anthostomella pinea]|uniref:Uu.00g004090.m01.CDS01 n=1 Tax=Anthostomella pinea TaxID=933095 RepID=A0AAI8VJT6_9PEZI|nr:Uu.00g004090.m01.CDS01 [Anthostomella pinea]
MADTQLQYFGSRKKKRPRRTQPQPQFHLFPQLPPELRCMIWRFYWTAKELPRIHHFRRWPRDRSPDRRYIARYPDRRVRSVKHDVRLRMSPIHELNDAVFNGFKRLPLPRVDIRRDIGMLMPPSMQLNYAVQRLPLPEDNVTDVDFAWWDAVREPLSLETIRVSNDGTTDWFSALPSYGRPADDSGSSSGQDQDQNLPQGQSLTPAASLLVQHTRYLFLSVSQDFTGISAADAAALRQSTSLHTIFLVHGLHRTFARCGRNLPHLPSFCKKNGLRILFGRYLTSAGLEADGVAAHPRA